MAAGAQAEFKPIPRGKCSHCGHTPGAWFNQRDEDIVKQFKAGVNTERLAKAYYLAQRTVQMKIIEALGQEAMWRIIRTHTHNEEEEE